MGRKSKRKKRYDPSTDIVLHACAGVSFVAILIAATAPVVEGLGARPGLTHCISFILIGGSWCAAVLYCGWKHTKEPVVWFGQDHGRNTPVYWLSYAAVLCVGLTIMALGLISYRARGVDNLNEYGILRIIRGDHLELLETR